MSNSDDSDDYKTGYRKPPKETQFKTGQSGNPKGRPKKSNNVKTVLKEALDEPIQITLGGKTKTVTSLQAMIRHIIVKALNGDLRAVNMILKEANNYFPEIASTEVPEARLTIMNICSECSKENTDDHPSNKIIDE